MRLTIDMPRWVWWLALRFRLAIALEVEGELLDPLDLVQHGRPLTLIYRGRGLGSLLGEAQLTERRSGHSRVRPDRCASTRYVPAPVPPS
jgi:hypothetical protein